MTKEKMISLTEGSSYIVTSLGSRDEPIVTKGSFQGFTVVGNTDAICIKLDKSHGKKLAGKTRVIPTHVILSLDIVTAKKEKEDKTTSTDTVFYR
jgi:hypothetical protein